MTAPAPVLCLGEAMVLCVPNDGQALIDATTASIHVAGAEANTASALAALGTDVEWFSHVGADPFGTRIVHDLRDRGVRHDAVVTVADLPTALYFKDPRGGTGVHYYRRGSAASEMAPADIPLLQLEARRLVHVTGITPALSDHCNDLVASVIAQPRKYHVSFDVNMRSALWPSTDAASKRLRELSDGSDIVFVGLDEASGLWGCESASDVAEILPHPALIVVKDGDREAVAIDRQHGPQVVDRAPALRVKVREPVGAGDAFAAGFLDGWLRGYPTARCLRRGHAVASQALLCDGDIPALDIPLIDALTG